MSVTTRCAIRRRFDQNLTDDRLQVSARMARMGIAPDLGVAWTKAKVDTGARSSSLHAINIEPFESDDEPWVRFVVSPWQQFRARSDIR